MLSLLDHSSDTSREPQSVPPDHEIGTSEPSVTSCLFAERRERRSSRRIRWKFRTLRMHGAPSRSRDFTVVRLENQLSKGTVIYPTAASLSRPSYLELCRFWTAVCSVPQ